MNTLRKPFTPDGDFVVIRKMIVGNTQFAPEPTKLFDKGLVSGRLLRMLYEQGYLDTARPDLAKPAPSERPRRRRFGDGSS